MNCEVVYLEPVASGAVKSELRSDALWGAICWAIRLLEGPQALAQFIQSYEDNEAKVCLISSAFPYSESFDASGQSLGKTHFFPVPLLTEASTHRFDSEDMVPEDIKLKHRKLNKKEKFSHVRQVRFETIINGKKESSVADAIPQIRQRPMTHNTIDRRYAGTRSIDEQGQLFHTDDTFILNLPDEKAGWFFLLQGADQRIKSALRFLEHFGIGGDRSIGKGRFKIHGPEQFTIETPNDANAQMTLSLYRPLPSEVVAIQASAEHANFHYALEERRGRTIWNKSTTGGKSKRRDEAALFFKEGSIFPLFENVRNICGQNPLVGQHAAGFDIFRYGHAFMLPLKIN